MPPLLLISDTTVNTMLDAVAPSRAIPIVSAGRLIPDFRAVLIIRDVEPVQAWL
jgi:hypothetical protein